MSYPRKKANGRQRGCSQRAVRSPAKAPVRGAQTELRGGELEGGSPSEQSWRRRRRQDNRNMESSSYRC